MAAERAVSTKLLSTAFYSAILADNDVYNRIYDQVLLDDGVRDAVEEAIPTELVGYDALIMILRAIAPPEYLRVQAEGAVSDVINYLRWGSDGGLNVEVDLGPVLDSATPVAMGYVQRRMEGIPVEGPDGVECAPGRAANLAESYLAISRGLADGRLPESLPSIAALSVPCRALLLETLYGSPDVFRSLAASPLILESGLDVRTVDILLSPEVQAEIRTAVVSGDTRGALKAVVPAVVKPAVEDAIEEFRNEWLDPWDNLEVIDFLDTTLHGFSASRFRTDAAEVRDSVALVRQQARNAAVFALGGGSLAMVLVFLPSWTMGLRSLGVALVSSGGLTFVCAKVMQTILAGRLGLLVSGASENYVPYSPSLQRLISDVSTSAIHEVSDEIVFVSSLVLIAGFSVLALSYVPVVRRRFRSTGPKQKLVDLH